MFVNQDEEVGDPGVDVQQQLRSELRRFSATFAEVGGSSPSKIQKRWKRKRRFSLEQRRFP